MTEPCTCCPHCSMGCRKIEHKAGDPCIWPQCQSAEELHVIVRDLTAAGEINPSDY